MYAYLSSNGHCLCAVEGYWARHLFKPRLTVLRFSYNIIANNFDYKIYFPFIHLCSKEGGEWDGLENVHKKLAEMWKGFGSVLELEMELFDCVDAFLAFWPLKKFLIKIKSQKESSNFSEVENNIKVEMIFRASISGMFNDKSNLPEQRKAELMHNDQRFFPWLSHLILSKSLHIPYKEQMGKRRLMTICTSMGMSPSQKCKNYR